MVQNNLPLLMFSFLLLMSMILKSYYWKLILNEEIIENKNTLEAQ